MCLKDLCCLGKSDVERERSPDHRSKISPPPLPEVPTKLNPPKSDDPPHKSTEVGGDLKGSAVLNSSPKVKKDEDKSNITAKASEDFPPKNGAEAAKQTVGSKVATKITDPEKQLPPKSLHKGDGRTQEFLPKVQDKTTDSNGGDDDQGDDDDGEAEMKHQKKGIHSERASRFSSEEE